MEYVVVRAPNIGRQVLFGNMLQDLSRILEEVPGAEVVKERPRGNDPKTWQEVSPYEVLLRWPRLIAHLICESLGYFTPLAAANALLDVKRNEPNYCEWYLDMSYKIAKTRFEETGKKQNLEKILLEVGKHILKQTIKNRRHHHGFMSDYTQAKKLVELELQGKGPLFFSW